MNYSIHHENAFAILEADQTFASAGDDGSRLRPFMDEDKACEWIANPNADTGE